MSSIYNERFRKFVYTFIIKHHFALPFRLNTNFLENFQKTPVVTIHVHQSIVYYIYFCVKILLQKMSQ